MLARVGLKKGNLTRGLIPAVVIGLLMGVAQLALSRQSGAIIEDISSGKFFWAFPAATALMVLVAGTTEEFFFRGVLQTSLTDWLRSRVAGVVISAVAFGFYHLPYAYYKEFWPSHGDWSAALMEGVVFSAIMGLILGAAYARYRNLLVPIIIHSMFNGMWAATTMF